MRRLLLFLMLMLPLCLMAQEVMTTDEADTTIITEGEIEPEYPGGVNNLYNDLLRGNLQYPAIAIEKGYTGKVIVSFVVEKDGSISNIKVEKDEVGYGAGEEVVRVVKTLKKFEPGRKDGKVVRCQFRLPVNFELYDDPPKKKTKKNRSNR